MLLTGLVLSGGTAVAAAPAPGPVPCQPGLGVGLVETPAGTSDPRAQSYIVDHVAPGATFTRRFQVCNGTAQAQQVQLYAAGAVLADGGFNVLPGATPNELTSWITVTPSVATIKPGERLIATATFAVPARATAGERYAALLAEVASTTRSTGVSLRQRTGVRVYLSVGPGGDPVSDFVVNSLQAVRRPDGTAVVLAAVHNTGLRAVDLRGTLQLSAGPGGLNAGPFAAELGSTLKPGDTAAVTFVLDRAIRGGPWQVAVDMRSGLLARQSASQLTFPDLAGVAPAAPAHQVLPYQNRHALIPLAGAMVALILLLFVLRAKGLLPRPRRLVAA